MRMQPWIDRLAAAYRGLEAVESRELVREVRGAASLAAAASAPARLTENTVFVAPAGDSAADSNPGLQVVMRRMLVVVALRDASDRLGGDGLSDLERAVAATLDTLLGWRPADAQGRVVYESGSLFSFEEQAIWWQMSFVAPVIVRGDC